MGRSGEGGMERRRWHSHESVRSRILGLHFFVGRQRTQGRVHLEGSPLGRRPMGCSLPALTSVNRVRHPLQSPLSYPCPAYESPSPPIDVLANGDHFRRLRAGLWPIPDGRGSLLRLAGAQPRRVLAVRPLYAPTRQPEAIRLHRRCAVAATRATSVAPTHSHPALRHVHALSAQRYAG